MLVKRQICRNKTFLQKQRTKCREHTQLQSSLTSYKQQALMFLLNDDQFINVPKALQGSTFSCQISYIKMAWFSIIQQTLAFQGNGWD